MCEYLRKIAVYALILQKSADLFYWRSCFHSVLFGQVKGNLGMFEGYLGENGAWSALIWKNTPTWKEMQSFLFIFIYFFEVIIFGLFFGQVCGNFGKNPSHSQAFACSYTYAQTSWWYWHVMFPVFSFVIPGFLLLFG